MIEQSLQIAAHIVCMFSRVRDLDPTRLCYPTLNYAQEVRRVAVEAFRKKSDWLSA